MRRYAVRCGPTENPVPWMEFWVGAGDKPKAAKFMMTRFPGLHVKGVFDLDDPEDAMATRKEPHDDLLAVLQHLHDKGKIDSFLLTTVRQGGLRTSIDAAPGEILGAIKHLTGKLIGEEEAVNLTDALARRLTVEQA